MNNTQQKLNSLGVEIPLILLPKSSQFAEEGELEKWAVIACDQFTQDRDYWEEAKQAADGAPSTLNLIFPEVFLSDGEADERIKNIHSAMMRYLKDGVFAEPRKGFIYIERDTPYKKKRRGLITAIDLEKYDWHPQARPFIRCTEGTVEERLPPRCNIRRSAPLELPHVLLLIDDDKEALLPALGEKVKNTSPVYDTKLMMNSGSVKGWFLDSENDFEFIAEKLDELLKRSVSRYEGGSSFLFAVGDGNHSLAAAKEIWNEVKAELEANGAKLNHPCRYALVEIENIYDPAIEFEPIHRVVFGINYEEIITLLSQLPDFSCRAINSAEELSRLCESPSASNCFGIICEERYALVETSAPGIATACLQPLLDKYASCNPQLIDYIHGKEEVFKLALKGGAAGVLLPPVQKSGLFETVGRLGPLPRKSFSMGHSAEKRFYFEARSLL
jgi:uncharacterized protein (DUF1015 family)